MIDDEYAYEYDEDGNLLFESYYDGYWGEMSSYTYEYDEDGMLTSYDYSYDWDGDGVADETGKLYL